MKNRLIPLLIILVVLFITKNNLLSVNLTHITKQSKSTGAFYTKVYQNLFTDLLGIPEAQVKARVDSAFNQLFYGNDETQRVYYPVAPDMAYMHDIWNNDVRTEGISYGMMIAVQLDKKMEFDRLWKWTKTYMQHQDGPGKGYFAWHCRTDGTKLDLNSASDGEEWFVMALYFAAARWGNNSGVHHYQADAQAILDAMLSKEVSSDRNDVVTNMFNQKEKQVVFVPVGNADDYTDPSYHLPHFYELWARWADKNNQFWCDAAAASRQFFKKATHPITGLAPDYARFDGTPTDPPWGGGHKNFQYDAWRVAMNIAVDYQWFARDPWAIEQSNRLLTFFHSQGIGKYGNLFTLDGKKLGKDHSAGLVAMNAVACLAATHPNKNEFVAEFWNTPIPSGRARYYDGLLYMLGLLHVSGTYKIYDLTGRPDPACLEN